MKLGLKDQINNEGALLTDAIVHVHWKKIGEDSEGNVVSYVSQTDLSAEKVSADSFINLNLISKEDVIEWIENSMTQKEKDNIEKILLKKIEKSKLRKIVPSWG